jgi:hypothetical protein
MKMLVVHDKAGKIVSGGMGVERGVNLEVPRGKLASEVDAPQALTARDQIEPEVLRDLAERFRVVAGGLTKKARRR